MNVDREMIWYEKDAFDERTGKTIAVLWVGDERYIGISSCDHRDQFNRKIGRSIALGRANRFMNESVGNKTKRVRSGNANNFMFSLNIKDIDAQTNIDGLKYVSTVEMDIPGFLLFPKED